MTRFIIVGLDCSQRKQSALRNRSSRIFVLYSKDLRKMGFTWEEAEVAALDRHGWRRSVAQCVQLDTG